MNKFTIMNVHDATPKKIQKKSLIFPPFFPLNVWNKKFMLKTIIKYFILKI
jgi:hypothetical protein